MLILTLDMAIYARAQQGAPPITCEGLYDAEGTRILDSLGTELKCTEPIL